MKPEGLKQWAAVIVAVMLTVPASVNQAYEVVRYDILGHPENDEEIFIEHMAFRHLFIEEEVEELDLNVDREKVKIALYPDRCISVVRLTDKGVLAMLKILPDPDNIDKIKFEMAGIEGGGLLMAEQPPPFSLGVHSQDSNYRDKPVRIRSGYFVRRFYGDGCELQFRLDAYGRADPYSWCWRIYKHLRLSCCYC